MHHQRRSVYRFEIFGEMGGGKAHYDGIEAFSETDFLNRYECAHELLPAAFLLGAAVKGSGPPRATTAQSPLS